MNLPDFYTKSHKTTDFNHCIGVIVQYIQQDNYRLENIEEY
jgi:hypothetical protein